MEYRCSSKGERSTPPSVKALIEPLLCLQHSSTPLRCNGKRVSTPMPLLPTNFLYGERSLSCPCSGLRGKHEYAYSSHIFCAPRNEEKPRVQTSSIAWDSSIQVGQGLRCFKIGVDGLCLNESCVRPAVARHDITDQPATSHTGCHRCFTSYRPHFSTFHSVSLPLHTLYLLAGS